jgi:hypothetical protein
MMMKRITTLLMLGMLLCAPSIYAEEQAAAGKEPVRDEQVIIRLATMGQYLRSLKVFAVHADTTDEDMQDNGQKLQFAGAVDYLVQTPDRIRLEFKNDVRHRIYTYDSKTLTQYSPLLGYYASMEISGTIGKMMLQAKEQYDLDMPLADLFLWGTDKADTKDIKEAAFVGVEQLNGHESEHFAFRQEGVDWQIWIQAGNKPLPDKLVITATDEPAQPSYAANLKWNLTPKLQKADFKFIPPKGAAKIHIVALDPAVK